MPPTRLRPRPRPAPRADRAATRREAIALLDALRRIVHELHRTNREAQSRVGLNAAQLLVLQQLGHASPLSVNALAERTFTHQSTVSTVVARLVRARLVRRRRAADDSRRAELSITERGRDALRDAEELSHTQLYQAVAALAPASRRSVARHLHELADSLGAGSGVPLFFDEPEPPARATKPASRKR